MLRKLAWINDRRASILSRSCRTGWKHWVDSSWPMGDQAERWLGEVYAPSAARVCDEQWNGSSWVNQVCTPWI